MPSPLSPARSEPGHAVDHALDHAYGLTRFLALELDLDLDVAFELDLAFARDLTLGFDPMHVYDLDRARHDFTTADLRGIDLTDVQLDRLRWSTITQWPSQTWREQALRDSTEIESGIYEVSPGTSTVPTHIL